MSQEIERKFLVNGEFKEHALRSFEIRQGYLCLDPQKTVRIRTKNEKAYITIKGKSNSSYLSRFEWEKEIPISEAQELLSLCFPNVIEKTRYEIMVNNKIFEVDEFHGLNEGLIVAEIELEFENEEFIHPKWIGNEVTDQIKYYNSQLCENPFKKWK